MYTQKVFPLIVESIIYVCTCVCVFFVCSSHDGCLNPESTSEIENFGTMHIFSFLIIYTEWYYLSFFLAFDHLILVNICCFEEIVITVFYGMIYVEFKFPVFNSFCVCHPYICELWIKQHFTLSGVWFFSKKGRNGWNSRH